MAQYLLNLSDTDYDCIKRAAAENGVTIKTLLLEGAKIRSVASFEQLQRLVPLMAELDAALLEILRGEERG